MYYFLARKKLTILKKLHNYPIFFSCSSFSSLFHIVFSISHSFIIFFSSLILLQDLLQYFPSIFYISLLVTLSFFRYYFLSFISVLILFMISQELVFILSHMPQSLPTLCYYLIKIISNITLKIFFISLIEIIMINNNYAYK